MITLRPGSHVLNFLQLLSITGEFPAKSLSILGNERFLKKLVYKLEAPNEFRFERDGAVFSTKLLQLSGKRDQRTVRLYKGALPILGEMHPCALQYYLNAFQNHRFPGDSNHILRNHRVAEAAAMCIMAGVESRPYLLPELQARSILRTVPEVPSFYFARDIKKLSTDELNKTIYTRVVGAMFCHDSVYAVYNTREAVMKWSGMGELKTVNFLTELARMNAGVATVNSAILFGASPETALSTILESDKTRRMENRFDRLYQHIHFVPMNTDGIQLLRILTLPDWNEKLLSALFPDELRRKSFGIMEHDAVVDGELIYSHLDGDIARLIRLRLALADAPVPVQIICYPWQVSFLRGCLGPRASLRVIDMQKIIEAVGAAERSPQCETSMRKQGP